MAILVTGGAGFVGLNLVEALLGRGEEVVLFDSGMLPRTAQRALIPHAGQLNVARADVRDAAQVNQVFESHRIEFIVHCAAVTSGAAREAREPAIIVDINVNGTLNVLEAARTHGVKRVIYTSSGAVYGESLYRLTRLYEESPVLPLSLYAITKFAAERVCARMRELWELDVVCARLGTVIGPWERDTGVRDNYGTHTQLAALAAAGRMAILPQREVRRDWVYSRDVTAGLIALLDAQAPHHLVYNLSSGVEWPHAIREWCEVLKSEYPDFDYHLAENTEQPNIWYTDGIAIRWTWAALSMTSVSRRTTVGARPTAIIASGSDARRISGETRKVFLLGGFRSRFFKGAFVSASLRGPSFPLL